MFSELNYEMNSGPEHVPPIAGSVEDPHYGKMHKKMLEFIELKEYQRVMDLMDKLITEKPDFFVSHDKDFENQYEYYKRELAENGGFTDYKQFILKVVEPFWAKVGAAGGNISDVYLEDVNSGIFN